MHLTQFLNSAAETFPNKIASIDGERQHTWSAWRDRMARLAAALRGLGMAPDDRVAILALNSDRYTEFLYSVWWAGGAVVPMNTRWSAAENAYSLNDSGAKILFIDRHFVPMLDAIRAACPQAFMGTGYGLTETSGSVAQAVGEDFIRNRAAAGRVLSLVDMKIDAPAGEPGEIMVRGPMVMKGYWNRPEDTAAVLSQDGWFRTGDIGLIDEEGYVFIVDRKKDMVISGGENIYCAEVERVMGSMDGVAECAAFGIADERLGELLVAIVVATDVTADAIKAEVGEKLARYKAPGHILFVDEPLPRNAVGKVDKIKLRAMWPDLAGA
jgi:acyl-CoA synthetase (AMP-forming)/AMP-acid ligase II